MTTWQEALNNTETLPPLSKNLSCDVCVIGGGIAGTTIAYMLAKEGRHVVLIDKGNLRESTTSHTTAFLTSTIDTDLTDLIKMYGWEGTKLIIDSHEDAIDKIEKIVSEENINCDFMRVPNYEISFSKKTFDQFKEDAEISNKMGHEVLISPDVKLPFRHFGIVESTNQAKFHPIKYLLALRAKAQKKGAEFYERTEATGIEGDGPVTIKLKSGHYIAAQNVVIATYNPFEQPWWYIFKKGMYKSYVYEIEIQKDLFPEAIFEDDDNPYFYFRVDKGESKDTMIVGGADHRHELPIDRERGFAVLDEYIKETLQIKEYEVKKKWTGPILEQTDGLAYIGRLKKNSQHCYVATAFSGNGMTYGTLSGMIITDLIMNRHNKYENLYRPYRGITFDDVVRKGRDYMEEFVRGIKYIFSSK